VTKTSRLPEGGGDRAERDLGRISALAGKAVKTRTRCSKDSSNEESQREIDLWRPTVIFLWTIFNVVFKQRDPPQVIPGWDGISRCSFMVSFDGKRHLSLSENHFARIEERDQADAHGSWSFDERTGKYTIAVDGEPVIYSVVDPGDRDNCMLIKGDPATVDLPRRAIMRDLTEALNHGNILLQTRKRHDPPPHASPSNDSRPI
jgi:hypothetical protein